MAFVTLTVLTGVVFPAALYGVARAAFSEQAEGSLVLDRGQVVGSRLIGQPFASPAHFQPRPSAAGDGYDAAASGGANLSPSNRRFAGDIGAAAKAYRLANGLAPDAIVPIDAATSSGSGLDPDIGPRNADLQVPRVARASGLPEREVRALVTAHTRGRQLGFLGEPRVDVLELNLALDRARRRAPG